MKYKKIKNWRKIQVRCALGLMTAFIGVCGGCADDRKSSVGDNEISKDGVTTDLVFGWEDDTKMPDKDEPEPGEEVESENSKESETEENSRENDKTDWNEKEYPELKYDGADWGLVYGETGTQPRGNEKPEVLKEYAAYYVGNPDDKVIYLTFDCGYENGNTDAILKALKAHDAKATFFVTGRFLEEEGELVNRMVDEGHAVGSHSYTHPDITKLPDKESLARELDQVKEKFQEVTGKELDMYFRPPEGKCSSKTLKWSQELGYATIYWSIAHVDWNTSNQPDCEKAIQTLTSRTHPGAIVLLHNTSSTNGEILDELMDKWEEMGYTFAPLSDLVGLG